MDKTPITISNAGVKTAVQAGYLHNTGTLNISNTATAQSEGDDVLKVLNALYSYRSDAEKQKDRNPNRVPGTCEWFTSHRNFQDWKTSPSKILWVSADPGSGKSVLAKYLVESILPTTKSRTTCYFFFKDTLNGATATAAFCCILFQLFEQKRSLLSKNIIERFKIAGESFCSSLSELWTSFLIATKDENAGEIVCILDALDECRKDDRSELIGKLQQLYRRSTQSNLKFLITSRPISEIRHGLHRREIPASLIHLSGESDAERDKISQEIDIFIEARVQGIGEKLGLTTKEKDILLKALRIVPNRTYLWVYLTLELIESNPSTYINPVFEEDRILEMTSKLPMTVNEAYEGILTRSRDRKKTKLLLQILVAAARPLHLSEMILAMRLAGKKKYHSYKRLHPILKQSEQRIRNYIRDLCGFFVIIIDSTVYLIHQTAKEFLVENKKSEGAQANSRKFYWRHSLRMLDCHRVLFKACVRHLYFAEFESRIPVAGKLISKYAEDHIFLSYSASHWAAHLRNGQVKLSEKVVNKVLKLCTPNSTRFHSWFQVYWATTNTNFPEGISTLMVASYFGIRSVVCRVLEVQSGRTARINATDKTYGRSSLSWAAGNGFEDIVAELLKARYRTGFLFIGIGAKVDSLDKWCRTPLTYAVWGGHKLVIEQLLKAGARAKLKDDIGGTPVSYAICSGRDDIVKKLLGAMANNGANSKASISAKLLLSAAEKGRDDVVGLLLEMGNIDLSVQGWGGRTPLMEATCRGNNKIVRLLLEKGADIKAKDADNRTSLVYAVRYQNLYIVTLLLEHGALDRSPGSASWSLLFDAAEASWDDQIIHLLGERALALGATFEKSETLLMRAAKLGMEETVRLLLERGTAVDTRCKEKLGHTALFYATGKTTSNPNFADWQARRLRTTRMLLEAGASVDAVDDNGKTPLAYAVIGANREIIKILLDKGANIEASDSDGRKPLAHAILNGNAGVVQVLLDKGANVEATGLEGRTALFDVIANPLREEVQRHILLLLLERGANIEATDKDGFTPLSWAVSCRLGTGTVSLSSLELLIAKGAVMKTGIVRGKPYSLLYTAIFHDDDALVTLLLDKGANIEERHKLGPTPLFYALRQKKMQIVRLLLEKGANKEVKGVDNKALRVNINLDPNFKPYTPHGTAAPLPKAKVEVKTDRGRWIAISIKDIVTSDYVS
ncbi:hypothetical protein TWF730_008902 [Orbilia blumenaviensis]|uniref:NACHT domain-containing protein n=1 Tax=Orbilia blumenaviensis TaxID=1796055 RepID=A0AAV9UZX8_9PEZI